MERTLYQTICKNLNKSCSIEFSFSQHHKGLDFSKYLKPAHAGFFSPKENASNHYQVKHQRKPR